MLFRPHGFLAPLTRGLLRCLSLLLRVGGQIWLAYCCFVATLSCLFLTFWLLCRFLFVVSSRCRLGDENLPPSPIALELPPARMEESHKGPSFFTKNFVTFGAGASCASTVAISQHAEFCSTSVVR